MLSIYHSTSPCKNQVMINNLGKLSERKKTYNFPIQSGVHKYRNALLSRGPRKSDKKVKRIGEELICISLQKRIFRIL